MLGYIFELHYESLRKWRGLTDSPSEHVAQTIFSESSGHVVGPLHCHVMRPLHYHILGHLCHPIVGPLHRHVVGPLLRPIMGP